MKLYTSDEDFDLLHLAVDKARKTKNIVFLDVGRTQTAFILQDALTTMALQGDEAAWNVEVRVHTLH